MKKTERRTKRWLIPLTAMLLLAAGLGAGALFKAEPSAAENVYVVERPNLTPPVIPEPPLPILVNQWNLLPEDYVPELTDIGEGYELDVSCAGALLRMLEDCRAAGNRPVVCSAYRSQEKQQELFDNRIRRYVEDGLTPEEAMEKAPLSVAVPGTSEHQLGLAVDIIDEEYVILDEGQEQTSTQRWLMENCAYYGFILRYPNGSTELTGIIYEPWHYRYVGIQTAAEISRLGITLEEYISINS